MDKAVNAFECEAGDEEMLVDAIVNEYYSQNYAAEPRDLSLKYFDENDQFNGSEHIFPGGFT